MIEFSWTCLTLQHYNMPVLMIDLVTLNQPKTHILIICVYILTVSQLSLLFILYIFCLHNFWSDKLLKDNFVNFENLFSAWPFLLKYSIQVTMCACSSTQTSSGYRDTFPEVFFICCYDISQIKITIVPSVKVRKK